MFHDLLSVVKPASDDQCTQADYLPLLGSEGYVSAKLAKDTGAGSLNCPWQFSAQQGQRINISIIDFHPHRDTTTCIPIAYITDINTKENWTICKPTERNHHAYLSESNSVQIQIITVPSTLRTHETLLLHYEGNIP